MSKSLIISLVSIVIGVVTIAVGLYVLSVTPVPEPDRAVADGPVVMAPQIPSSKTQKITPSDSNRDVPSSPVEPGTEPWCEKMMVAPDAHWTDSNAHLFAKHCVYP